MRERSFYGRFERLAQADIDRELMIERCRRFLNPRENISVDKKIRSLHKEFVLRFGALSLAVLGAFSAGFGQVGEKKATETDDINDPASVNGEQWEEDVAPFLSYPVERKSDIKIAQVWIYSGINNGQPHRAIDYFRGESPADHRDWRTFTVVAAADGNACLNAFNTVIFGTNYSVRIKHGNGYETRYLHLDKVSLDKRWRQFPSCSQPESLWLYIRRGDEIADAGDSGTVPGWTHLDFRVLDRLRKNVDPYDVYSQDRRLYPDLLLTNGRYCGPDALFFEDICPRASASTGDQVEPTPTSTPTPKLEANGFLVLDGEGDGIEVPNSESLELRDEITIEARIRLKGSRDIGDAVLAKGESSEPYVLWARFWKCEDGAIAAFFGVGMWGCAAVAIEPGQWVDLAVTFNKREMIFYLNGLEVGRVQAIEGLVENDEPLFIGLSPVPGNEDCNCDIDFELLWKKARNQEQIVADFKGEFGTVSDAEEAGLVGWWEFNGDFSDSTSYHNNGIASGDAHIATISELGTPQPLSEPR